MTLKISRVMRFRRLCLLKKGVISSPEISKYDKQLRFAPPETPGAPPSAQMLPGKPIWLRRQTRILDPTTATRQRNFMSRMKNYFDQERPSDPFAIFSITVNAPSSAHVGDKLPITLSNIHLGRSDSVLDPPPVTLRGVRVKMFAQLPSAYPCFPAKCTR
ncbi:uncharacterized protein BDR25DRAFT_372084 [Lindgomyces ingoldianus]|uniref:Uncharacterized protein n=1 Tax=Lindgomyces ingoldianus TaxID=673940 RepID=A0ACB6QTQ6_9PLEO|nr:uncharacterized protein BDR25DRAFT_372084 [Lindgomyces ingoldianus]KAF2469475.1 hypothetical protein BDR25DRAFT_372084 [Lindgomyces ingoldianus]